MALLKNIPQISKLARSIPWRLRIVGKKLSGNKQELPYRLKSVLVTNDKNYVRGGSGVFLRYCWWY